jgi:glycosyltransferase involved in cell wall biosynthesis
MRRRSRTGETWLKRVSAHMFYRLLNRISRVPIPPDTGDFRLLSRRAVDALRRLPERNRYMKGLFAWIGMPARILDYDRAPRAAGSSKWNYLGLLCLACEGVTSFSVAPLRWAMGLGLITAAGGGLFGAWIVVKTVFLGAAVPGYPSLIAMITFLGGVQLLTIGLLGEYVGKIYLETKQRPLYLVRDILESRQSLVPRVDHHPTVRRPDHYEYESYAATH